MSGQRTHPYDAGARARSVAYRHGHTFTWTAGDDAIAVQRGRVANAKSRLVVVRDAWPKVSVQLGRVPVVAWLPTSGVEWHDADALAALADRWHAAQTQRKAAAA